jgi:hypothetical protein
MMQFGAALYKDDSQNTEILEFIQIMKLGKKLPTEIIEKFRHLTRQSLQLGRSVLIYSRLYFWGYINFDEAVQDLSNLLGSENFHKLDAYERTEIASCLGPRLTSQLTGIDIKELIDYKITAQEEAVYNFPIEYESDEIWHYTPPPSGFFSIVENILIAKFICHMHRKIFRLDRNFQRWWRYPVPFNEIFPEMFERNYSSVEKPIRYMQWNVARDIMKNASYDVLKYYSKYKNEEYKKVKNQLKIWLNSQGESIKTSEHSAIFYIRGGDKLVLETINPPAHLIEEDFNQIFNISDHFMVLSDDFQLADDFRIKFGNSKIENITNNKYNGYFIADDSSVDEVQQIIKNYMVISSVKYSMSCPSSNLVNSAHWSNDRLQMIPLKSSPVSRYRYL